jgi:hypothetical protein
MIDTVDGQIVEESPLPSKPSKRVSGRFTGVARADQNRPHEPRLHHCIFPTHHECHAQANAAITKERTAQLRRMLGDKDPCDVWGS